MSKAAAAAEELEKLEGDRWFWIMGKGRGRPTEPLYGVWLFDHADSVADKEATFVSEGHTWEQAVAGLKDQLRSAGVEASDA